MPTEKSDYHEWDEPKFPVDTADELKGVFGQIDADTVLSGAIDDRPSPSTAGRIYFAYDEPSFYRDDGSSWNAIPFADESQIDYLESFSQMQARRGVR